MMGASKKMQVYAQTKTLSEFANYLRCPFQHWLDFIMAQDNICLPSTREEDCLILDEYIRKPHCGCRQAKITASLYLEVSRLQDGSSFNSDLNNSL